MSPCIITISNNDKPLPSYAMNRVFNTMNRSHLSNNDIANVLKTSKEGLAVSFPFHGRVDTDHGQHGPPIGKRHTNTNCPLGD
jgi:hypothetical protein